jgi:hypothetical protein
VEPDGECSGLRGEMCVRFVWPVLRVLSFLLISSYFVVFSHGLCYTYASLAFRTSFPLQGYYFKQTG